MPRVILNLTPKQYLSAIEAVDNFQGNEEEIKNYLKRFYLPYDERFE